MKITVAVDIMGGDNPPSELAKGAVDAANEFASQGLNLILVCTEDAKAQLPKLPENVSVETANSIVEMIDDPSVVMKEKKDSTLVTAVTLCKEGRADAVVSAGNTGALFTASSLIIRRIKGVRRAALASIIPVEKPYILLDCGANLDATPEILQLYARMGSIYAEVLLGRENPRVGLLNNGTEPHKGTALYQETYALLSQDENINFVGNCEGKSLPFGSCDVLVCDGFMGNIALKIIEGMAKFMGHCIKGIFHANPITKIGGALTLKQTKALKEQVDPSEYGGAPFLGLAKPVVKAHGNSDAKAFKNAIGQAVKFTENGVIAAIEGYLAEMKAKAEKEQGAE